jgi:hypothetical protein
VLVAGTRKSSFRYVLPMRTTVRLAAGGGDKPQTGSIRVVPSASNAMPAPTAIFSFAERGITVSQTSVSAPAWSDRYRVYVEKSGGERIAGSVRSGIAIGNSSQSSVTVQLDLTRLDGQRAGYSTVIVPAGGQVSRFLDELFSGFPAEFRGVLRISAAAAAAAPSPIVVTGIRGRYNERGDLLLTSTPAASETAVSPDKPLVFPYVVNGNGYSTQLILFSGTSAGISGRLFHNNSEGVLLKETVKPVLFEK